MHNPSAPPPWAVYDYCRINLYVALLYFFAKVHFKYVFQNVIQQKAVDEKFTKSLRPCNLCYD